MRTDRMPVQQQNITAKPFTLWQAFLLEKQNKFCILRIQK